MKKETDVSQRKDGFNRMEKQPARSLRWRTLDSAKKSLH
jgi:hypothetical protein